MKFLIVGNKNALTYKEVFKSIKDGKLWLGINSPKEFELPDGKITKKISGLCRWFTNLDYTKRHEDLELTQKFEGYL